MYRIRRVSGLHKGILNDDVPKGLFLEHFFISQVLKPVIPKGEEEKNERSV